MCIRMLLFCKKLQEQNQKHHWLAWLLCLQQHPFDGGFAILLLADFLPSARPADAHDARLVGLSVHVPTNPPNSMSISRVCFCRRSGTERIMCTGSQHHAHQKGFALPRARVISVAKNRKPATSCASVGCCFANTRPGGNKSGNNHINQKPTSRAS